jgi:hypothetical protein
MTKVYDIRKEKYVDISGGDGILMNELLCLIVNNPGFRMTGMVCGVKMEGNTVFERVINLAKKLGIKLDDNYILELTNVVAKSCGYGNGGVRIEGQFVIVPEDRYDEFEKLKRVIKKYDVGISVCERYITTLDGKECKVVVMGFGDPEKVRYLDLGERVICDDKWFTGLLFNGIKVELLKSRINNVKRKLVR